jgi:hypothetical protein
MQAYRVLKRQLMMPEPDAVLLQEDRPLLDLLHAWHALDQALQGNHTKLNLHHIHPTAVLERVVELQFLTQPPTSSGTNSSLRRAKRTHGC